MRTTLVIDDDVLAAAKGLALRQHKSIGEVISGWPARGCAPAPRLRLQSATECHCYRYARTPPP